MNGENILVEEDELAVTKQICSDLNSFGYKVFSTASTGDGAVRKVGRF